jgi:3-oxoacyl-[acyl-carrier protein] reductase
MNRKVLITGSTRGIGFATAAEFLKNGDQVLVFCRHLKHVKEAVRRLSSSWNPENIFGLTGDVRKEADAKRIVGQCLKRFGGIDILINNAGIAAYQSIEETTLRVWNDILNTNLMGPFIFVRQVLPSMKEQGSGIIINVSSGLGVEGEANFSAYCASKFGVIGLTQVAADEARENGIKIYAVLPGAVRTRLNADLGLGMDPSELLSPEYVAKRIFEVAEGKQKTGSSVEVYS